MKIILQLFIGFACIFNLQANVIVLNGLTHSYSGVSGQVFEGEVVLANTSTVEQRVSFSLNEAIYDCNKGRAFVEGVNHINSSTNWFNGAVSEKILEPKEKYIFKYSITVPSSTTLDGSFWTTLMINVDKPIREETVANIGLDTKIRYAVRILVDVNIPEDVNFNFKSINIKSNNTSKRQLIIKVLNDSKFIENVKLSLEFYNKEGEKVYEIQTNRSKVFPKVCREFLIDISDLSIGVYQCLILADARDEYIGTQMDIAIR